MSRTVARSRSSFSTDTPLDVTPGCGRCQLRELCEGAATSRVGWGPSFSAMGGRACPSRLLVTQSQLQIRAGAGERVVGADPLSARIAERELRVAQLERAAGAGGVTRFGLAQALDRGRHALVAGG